MGRDVRRALSVLARPIWSLAISLLLLLAAAAASDLWIEPWLAARTSHLAAEAIHSTMIVALCVPIFWFVAVLPLRLRAAEAESAARAAARKLALAQRSLDTSADIVLWIDAEARILYANERAVATLGYTRDELLALRVPDVNMQRTLAEWPATWEEFRAGRIKRFETIYRTKSGRTFPAEVTASLVHDGGHEFSCTFVRDITERQAAEQALRLTQVSLDRAVDAVVWVEASGRIVYANEAACRLLVRDHDQLVGLELSEVDLAITREDWPDRWNSIFAGRVTAFESIHARGDGSSYHAEVHVNPVSFRGRELVCAYFQDITPRREAELALSQAHAAAMEASRLKSEFLSSISHELRTPLNGVIGMSDLLLASRLTDDQRDWTQTQRECAAHLLRLINDILDFAKLEAGHLAIEGGAVDIDAVVRGVVDDEAGRAAEKGLALRLGEGLGSPRWALGDAARVRQVVALLVDNAIKFTECGEIMVAIRTTGLDTSRPMQRVSVVDTGIGIPEEKRAAIFDGFTQAEGGLARRHGGAGLGLAIARDLVRIMGGEIGVSGRGVHGSMFWFTLPLAAAPAGAAAAREAPDAVAARRDTTPPRPLPKPVADERRNTGEEGPTGELAFTSVLLVEDNAVNAKLAIRLLEKMGCRVALATNGAEAVSAFQRAEFAVILMDLQMPVMDGLEATREIRFIEQTRERRTPIIAMTANSSPADRERCLEAGMDDMVAKPFNPALLSEKLTQWAQLGEPTGPR